jgi:hypothetical protein
MSCEQTGVLEETACANICFRVSEKVGVEHPDSPAPTTSKLPPLTGLAVVNEKLVTEPDEGVVPLCTITGPEYIIIPTPAQVVGPLNDIGNVAGDVAVVLYSAAPAAAEPIRLYDEPAVAPVTGVEPAYIPIMTTVPVKDVDATAEHEVPTLLAYERALAPVTSINVSSAEVEVPHETVTVSVPVPPEATVVTAEDTIAVLVEDWMVVNES